jgi:hypothetical protein
LKGGIVKSKYNAGFQGFFDFVPDTVSILMTMEEAKTLTELLGQFTCDTCLKILRDGDYPDALAGFDIPYDRVIDDLYGSLCKEIRDE